MPKAKLTDITIRSLKPPKKGQTTYWDQNLGGFGVRVSQGGTKTFLVMHGTNRRRTTLGRYPILTLSDARTEAKRLMAEITLGKLRLASVSFLEAQKQFLAASRQKNKPNTVYRYQRHLERHFPFGSTLLTDISTDDVMRRINRLRDTPSEQNHAFMVARTFFRWAARNRLIDRSPLEGLSLPSPIGSRERVLSENELKLFYTKALSHPYPFGPIIALLVLTGARRTEVASLEWEWIDHKDRTITLPSTITKNNITHTFPFGHHVAAVFEKLPRIYGYVFPAHNQRSETTTVFNGWSKAKTVFDEGLQLAPYTLHDLRRTFVSTLDLSPKAPSFIRRVLLLHNSLLMG
ncbi:MAG: integrase arm-type DNA-binding domain-containing protein, partial [Alphaproteobacteria bacterium]|nr:integrase arm-type DNA-binding domain-containing protein [Alphaproteobacteria bacterium]